MKQYFLSIIFLFFLACNVGFGQDCAADLSKQKADLEKVIADIDAKYEDKRKLKDLPNLFKSCVSKTELENIKTTYLSLKFDASQSQTYKTIIKKVLEDNKLLCVNFANNTQKGINKNYVADLDALLKEYEGLKAKNIKTNTYNGTPTENNYNVLNQLKSLLNDCVVSENLKTIKNLNNQIITEGFNGGKTMEFNANLREILNENSELFETQTIATPTIQDTAKTPETAKTEEVVVPKKSESNLGTYLFYILLFISIAANGYFVYEKFIKKPKKPKENKEPEEIINKPTVYEKQKLEGLENKNKELSQKNEELQKQLDKANDKIKTLESAQKVEVTTSMVNQPVNQKNSYSEIQYFASPNEQGEFIAKNGQNEVKEGASIYKFEIKGAEATFEFFNHGSTFQSTLNNPNRLNFVCDFINNYNSDAIKITTKTKGIATLQDGKWKVIQKAKIRYEA
jgi:hypothetical protein